MIKLRFDASNPVANIIRIMVLVFAAGSLLFNIDLIKLIFKKTTEEMKSPNITETMTTEQYAEVLELAKKNIIEKQKAIQAKEEMHPPINNEKETAITISESNRVLVPVTIGYRGKMVTVPLLLDTGATGIVISPAVAQRLGMSSEETTQGQSTVADRRVVAHYSIEAAFVAVGPKTKKPLQVHILPNVGNQEIGLLGMSFLADFPHMIDLKSQTIKWM